MPSFIFPFKGLYPDPESAQQVIAPPYDVVTRSEAKQLAHNKPHNFLHISHAEIDLADDIDEHDAAVYAKAKQNLDALLKQNILKQDNQDCFYIYQMQQGVHQQTGVLAKVTCKAYQAEKVRRHELTRPDKVLDRSLHIEALKAQVSPTLLACKQDKQLTALLKDLTQDKPLLEATLQNVIHRIWRVENEKECEKISTLLNAHETIYIADGHHRNEAANHVFAKHPAFDNYLVCIFPEDELKILGYHRVIKKLNKTAEDFLAQLKQDFNISKTTLAYPKQKGDIVLYVKGQAYLLQQHSEKLDVDVLTEKVLTPILNITDIRQDKNIAFIGGLDALTKIETKVDANEYEAAFIMYPTSMQELLTVADAKQIMPPKSTWFEPKLADGLMGYLY